MDAKISCEDDCEDELAPPPLNVLLTVPSLGFWHSHTGQCIADMCAFWGDSIYDGKKSLQVLGLRGTLPVVRRLCVAEVLSRPEITHHLWVDSDMVFPPDSLNRLLRHNMPVVGVNYFTKTLPPKPVAYCDSEDNVGPLWTDANSTGLVEVQHTGMGLMLVDVRVYEKLSWPMFKFEEIAPQNFRDRGEDVYFCNQVRNLGLSVWIDQDLSKEIKHIGDLEYDWMLADKSEKKLQEYRKEQWATPVAGSTKEAAEEPDEAA